MVVVRATGDAQHTHVRGEYDGTLQVEPCARMVRGQGCAADWGALGSWQLAEVMRAGGCEVCHR